MPELSTREALEVSLRDSISPGLRAIAKELRELNKAAKEAAQGVSDGMDQSKKKTEEAGKAVQETLRQYQELARKIVETGKEIIGIGGATESFRELNKAIGEFVTSTLLVNNFARDTGFTVRNIEVMRGSMERMGLETKQADQYISTLGGKLQELRALREGSQLFQDLQKMGPGGVELGKRLMGDVDKNDFNKAFSDIIDVFKTQSPKVQFWMAQTFGIPQSVIDGVRQHAGKVREMTDADREAVQEYQDALVDFNEKVNSEWTRFANHAIHSINDITDTLNKKFGDQGEESHVISDFFIKGADAISAAIKQDIKDVEHFATIVKDVYSWYEAHVAPVTPKQAGESLRDAVGKVWNAPDVGQQLEQAESGRRLKDTFDLLGKSGTDESKRLQTEDNKLLGDIKDTLTKMELNKSGMTGGPGSQAGYGQGLQHEGGPMKAPLGGFRRGARSPADAKYEGESQPPSGPGGVINRERFDKEMANNPALRDKVMAIAAGEQSTPLGQQKVIESMMNRAAMTGTSLAYQARTTAEGGYYAGYKPGALNDPAQRKSLTETLDKVKGGSNTSNYATDNASGNLAEREARSGAFRVQSTENGETFFSPGSRNAGGGRNRARYEEWRAKVDQEQKGTAFDKGTAAVTVDFAQAKNRATESQSGGPIFKELKVGREAQAPKAGSPPPSDFNSRWYFQ
jgi:hypothetical protein